ncbi:MAG: hypothetical protein B1H09_04345 [Gemmatimonadaceae bacterium 4484_173]|nr:MAG: hypothetical protein B1H09_04345 [Gemmatimonadaceae bacterium 4484_173]RKZ04526.1 MAG: hypothetical protein DRQ21_02480 [Candidatus Fermentibacteria bacterium]
MGSIIPPDTDWEMWFLLSKHRGVYLMKRTLVVLAVFALVAFAGDMVSGSSDLTKFTGYGNFRWTMYGEEDVNPSSTMSTYSYLSWVPKLNEYADAKVAVTVNTPGDEDFKVSYAYLNLHFTENFTLSGGQMNIPFGYAYTRSGGSMYFADRSLLTVGGQFARYAGKDIMTMLTAEFAPVTVDLALSNGVDMNTAADNDVNKQFTARVAVDPVEWATIGGSIAMVGTPDIETEEDTTEAFSSNGMDFFALANYPVSSTGTFRFVGEYMILGFDHEVADTVSTTDATRMSIMGGYDMDLDGDVFVRIMPAVRYDAVNPWYEGDTDPESSFSRIDFCVNVGLFSENNTLQIGARNYGFEYDKDGYTDIYTNWRMNF